MSADRLTYANVMATIAVVMALTVLIMFGFYASSNRNESNSRQTVSSGEINDDAVDSQSVLNGSLQLEDLNVTQLRSLVTEAVNQQRTRAGTSGSNGSDGSSIVGPRGDTGRDGQRGPRGLPTAVASTRLIYDSATQRRFTVADGSRFVKVRRLGTFNKQFTNTLLTVTFVGHGRAIAPATTCQWQIRIDDETSRGQQADGAEAITGSTAAVPIVTNNQFDNIGSGQHTASLWLKSTAGAGCEDNPGNYRRMVQIEERRVSG